MTFAGFGLRISLFINLANKPFGKSSSRMTPNLLGHPADSRPPRALKKIKYFGNEPQNYSIKKFPGSFETDH
jgi:hypothetical protein